MISQAELPTYRNPIVVGGALFAAGSLLAYLIGYYLHQGPPPSCDQYVYCTSERDRWSIETRQWFVDAFLVGLLVAWSALVWRPISRNHGLRRVGSVLALVGCVPLACLLWIAVILVSGNTCEPDALLCFDGTSGAAFFAAPATVVTVLSILLAVALASRDDRRIGRVCGTLALTFISATLVLVSAGLALAALPV